MFRPFGVTEVGGRGSSGENEVVVRETFSVGERDRLVFGIDRGDLSKENPGVALTPQDPPNRSGDVARVERRRRNLIEEGLEDVMGYGCRRRSPHGRPPQTTSRV